MGAVTGISWTDHTFNPWWGCARVSPGCEHCYAEALDRRVGGAHWGARAPRRTFGDAHWNEPRRWNLRAQREGRRHRVFCASMADVFDAEAPDGARERLWALIRETPGLDWQILSKRPENMAAMLPVDWGAGYRNVWLGVTAENQAMADRRIPVLLERPAAVRFVSYEPALGPIRFDENVLGCVGHLAATFGNPLVNWVIVGGESGPQARTFDLAWARSVVAQCKAAGVACFVKQLGTSPLWNPGGEDWWKGPHVNADGSPRFADRKGGDVTEWPEDLRVQEFPMGVV